MTVFSAANYVDQAGNKGGIIEVEVEDGEVRTEYVRENKKEAMEKMQEKAQSSDDSSIWTGIARCLGCAD